MNKIKFKTIKNSTIEIFYEKNKNYTVKDMKNLIETQYGWDHKKLKIYKDKYDINSLLNDDYPFPLDLYLKKIVVIFIILKIIDIFQLIFMKKKKMMIVVLNLILINFVQMKVVQILFPNFLILVKM